jgi:hypothetical protein
MLALGRVSSQEAVRLREVWRVIGTSESGAAMYEALPIDELRRDVLGRVREGSGAGLSVIATDDTLRA